MRTEFVASSIQHSKPHITIEDQEAVNKVLQSGMLAEGECVCKFEHAVSRCLGVTGGVATSSGTTALYLALMALGVGCGDEIIIPTYVCRSVWDAVVLTGAQPVLCDIGEDWCMNVDTVKKRVTKKTKAIVLVHIFGIVAVTEQVIQLGIPVIEDCCQAFAAVHGNIMAGTAGVMGVASFYATKLLATGEGGMVFTNDTSLLEKIVDLKHGAEPADAPRKMYPMTDIQAALGLSQLGRYPFFLQRRAEIAAAFFDNLDNLTCALPVNVRGRSIFFRFPLRSTVPFESLRAIFSEHNIQVRKGVDTLLHRIFCLSREDFPQAEKLFSETVCLPVYPALKDNELQVIISACREIFS